MSTLAAQWTLSQNTTAQQAIRMSMVKNALAVVAEASDSSHPVKHTKRHDLAVRVLNDPDYYLMRFVYAAVALDTLTGSSSDAQINAAVLSLFDLISGVDAND